MPIGKKIFSDHRKPAIGDMRWLIDIFTVAITPPDTSMTIDYTLTKTPDATIWASVKTLPNVAIFDGQNTEQVVSHQFIIRYRSEVTQEKYLRYPATIGQYYNIITVEDFENRNEFMLLRCNLRGAEA